MKGLMYKDLYVLGNYGKAFIFQIAIMILLTFLSLGKEGDTAMVVTMAVVMASMTMSIIINGTFAYDESAKWGRAEASLPLSRKTVVKTKYLFCLACCAILVLFVSAFAIFIAAATGGQVELLSLLAVNVSTVLILNGVIISVSLPIAFKFGAEKSRIATFSAFGGIFALFMIAITLIKKVNPSIADYFIGNSMLKWAGVIVALVVVLAIIASYFVSVKFYEKREF